MAENLNGREASDNFMEPGSEAPSREVKDERGNGEERKVEKIRER